MSTWVMVHAGPSAIVHQLKALRIALPIVLALSLCRLLLQTLTCVPLRQHVFAVDR
jgi:hypothetical protein